MNILDCVALIIKYFKNRRVGGVREGLVRYPYLKHLIKLCPGDWVNHMEKMNEVIGEKNRLIIF